MSVAKPDHGAGQPKGRLDMSKLSDNARSRDSGLKVVMPPAQIDIANADRLLYELMSAARDASIVVLDMTATTFCDSSGFSRMVIAGDHLRASGGDLRVVCSARMHMLMTINKDDEHFSVFPVMIEAFNAQVHSAYELSPAA
jgi:anti-sigma B factor antagonist